MSIDNWVGKALPGGRYQVTAHLGAGGMGSVYKAHDRTLDRDVVIKVPRRSLLDDPDFAVRFAREIRSLVQLEHPHIVKVLDAGENEGLPFAVLQYLPGGSLRDRLVGPEGENLSLPPESLADWLEVVAAALDFMHGKGYIHRDVKPENILFDAEGHVYLSDFGVAKALAATPAGAQPTLTGTGVVFGTAHYMAPELSSDQAYDGRIDQYALGVTVYEALSGRRPFEGPTAAFVLALQLTRQPAPLQTLTQGLPETLAAAVHRALAKEPNLRFPSCTAFARHALATLAVPARTTALPHKSSLAVPVGEVLTVNCPKCGKALPVQPTARGKRVRCGACQAVFVPVPEPPPGPTGPLHPVVPTAPVKVEPAAKPEPPKPPPAPTAPEVPPPVRKPRDLSWLRAFRHPWVLGGAGFLGLLLVGILVGSLVGKKLRSTVRPLDEAGAPATGPSTRGVFGSGGAANSLRIVALAPVDLEAGKRAAVEVKVERQGYRGPVLVTLEGVPAKVNTLPGRIAEAEDAVRLDLVAEADAAEGAHPVTVRASAEELSTTGQFTLTLKRPAGLPRELTNAVGLKLVLVPAGSFRMGSPPSEPNRYDDEGPQHEVAITKPFYLGAHEVTQAQYQRVMGENPANFHAGNGGGPDHPVEQVTWYNAVDFCRRLSALPEERKAGRVYRLPTEAEWEYACRAGTTTPVAFGGSLSSKQANFDGTQPFGGAERGPFRQRTQPVGSYPPNAFGLYDMHGNVWEWCSDFYAGRYDARGRTTDPTGPAKGDRRVHRGGSWLDEARDCRSAVRDRLAPSHKTNLVGFRVACPVNAEGP